MSVKNVERQEKNKVKLTIEISAEAFEAAIEKVYRKNKGQIAIPGFRKGKAPRKLIEKMYGAELFYEEAINEVYPQALDDAIVEEDISVAGYPKMSVESAGPEGVVLIAEVAEKPEISVENYKGVVAPYEDVEVTEHDIEVAMTPYISRAKTQWKWIVRSSSTIRSTSTLSATRMANPSPAAAARTLTWLWVPAPLSLALKRS